MINRNLVRYQEEWIRRSSQKKKLIGLVLSVHGDIVHTVIGHGGDKGRWYVCGVVEKGVK
jgi:hypothetical protein